MNIAIIGCGFVADYYMTSLAQHPSLTVVAAMDIVPAHADRFHAHWKVPVFYDAASLLAGASFDMVLNLTNPHAHYEISKLFLEHGRHVYTEKPMAMDFDAALELYELARARNLSFSSAPCNHLAEAAQTIADALAAGRVGTPRLVYAEMDDNFIALSAYKKWKNVSGAPWPYADEFEVGCSLEHAGYYLSWLMMFFGPVKQVVAFASLQHPGKPVEHRPEAPDFSVACLEFHSGVVARLTCSVLAPRDHSLRIVGDKGVLFAQDSWFYTTPVYVRSYLTLRRRFMLSPFRKRLPTQQLGPKPRGTSAAAMDFARGPAEMARAIRTNTPSRMPADFALHVNEVALAIHHATRAGACYQTRTSFERRPTLEQAPGRAA